MGKVYDITDKLTGDKPSLKIGEKTYAVDNSKNTFLKIQKQIGGSREDALDIVIQMALGQPAYNEIEKLGLSMAAYKNIVTAIMAAVMEMEFEEAEKSFRSEPRPV